MRRQGSKMRAVRSLPVLGEQLWVFQHCLQTLFMLFRECWHELLISKIICLISKTELSGQFDQSYLNHLGNFYMTKQSKYWNNYVTWVSVYSQSNPPLNPWDSEFNVPLIMTFKWPVMWKSKVSETNFRKWGSRTRSFCNMFWKEHSPGISPVQNTGLCGKQKSVQIQGKGTYQDSPGGIF